MLEIVRRALMAKNMFIPRFLQSFGIYRVSPPEFFILGAQKAGTTALFQMLVQHPSIIPPLTGKELQFFNKKHSPDKKDFQGYARCLPPDSIRRRRMTFDATPGYLFYEHVPAALHSYAPNAKLIVLLREPEQRAYSQWKMMRYKWQRLGRTCAETRPFGVVATQHNDQVVQRGVYVEQLQRYLKYYPPVQLLVIDSNQLKNDPKQALNQVFEFLEIPQHRIEYKQSHMGEGRNEDGDVEAIEYLRQYYQPHNRKLKLLLQKLGYSMSWL